MAGEREEGAKRGRIDRLMSRVAPRPVEGFRPPPTEIAPGVWAIDRKIDLRGGLHMPVRSIAVRLADGSLWIHSPPRLDDETRAQIDSLGRIRHVVAPNSFHHVYVAETLDRYRDAKLWLAPALAERRPELPPGAVLESNPPAEWAGEIDQAVYGPVRGISEVVFFHRASRALLLTDLSFHICSASRWQETVVWRIAGIWNRFGPSRLERLVILTDRAAVARLVKRVLEWPFERVLVAHGETLDRDARETFRAAFRDWL